jgi:small subunit ribosomal protein S9
MPETEEFVATGRRKTSVARIRMTAGSGKIDINGRSFEDYFPTVPLQNVVLQPLQTAKAVNAYDLSINTTGGGIMGQAGAAQLAIARALLLVDGNLRGTLKTLSALASLGLVWRWCSLWGRRALRCRYWRLGR